MKKHSLVIVVIIWIVAGCTLQPIEREAGMIDDQRIDNFYSVEDVPLPEGLTAEIGGMDFMPDGRMIVCFHRGEVMTYDPKEKTWELFAEGLHDPLGILALNNWEVLVMQRPELTRLVDNDNDGEAEEYLVATDDFGISGNYHEFAYGPAYNGKDLYIALNCASKNAGIWDEVRGKVNMLGEVAGMYSAVEYRGWVMKLREDGVLEPVASGFRSPDGIGFDLEGNLFVTDNQGDWLGTSTLYHVEEENFYGQISSLVWREGWSGDPEEMPVSTLDSMRTKAAVLFPHNIMSNSPTQPLVIPEDSNFGPFAGQLLVGEMDFPRIMRVMLEKVNGKFQGACTSFIDSAGLSIGNHRMVFGPDGSLWVGKSAYVWVGDRGIQRIRYNGGMPMDVLHMNVIPEGFKLTFTRPVDRKMAEKPDNYQFSRYYYAYHQKYGSPRMDEQPVAVKQVQISEDGKEVLLTLAEMIPGYVYDLQIGQLSSMEGVNLKNRRLFYTLNELPNNQTAISSR
ncbi:MAG: hypothetical protein AAF632_01325 [Bacteroidota bacterium]